MRNKYLNYISILAVQDANGAQSATPRRSHLKKTWVQSLVGSFLFTSGVQRLSQWSPDKSVIHLQDFVKIIQDLGL